MATNILDQVQNVQGIVAAARKRDSWARREANATDEGDRRLYREALFDLEEKFPDLKEIPVGGAEGFARERGHGRGSRSPVHDGRQRRASSSSSRPEPVIKPGAKGRGPDRKPIPGVDPTARRRPRRGSPAPSPRSTPRVDRAIAQTGLPSAADSVGSTFMALLGTTVGLSLGYLVLSSSEKKGSGAAAVPTVVEGVTKDLGRFIGTGDVFSDNRPTSRAATGTQATAPVGPARLARRPKNPHQFNNR